ncbi:MAG: hypothetical protein JRI99_05100 [Deltaproteobacteria bacterium]|nr:hypothetical protein [Deltaproteobacteria bacterium]
MLAHFFEDEGIPTTQISLIRLHTQTIKPPRALWVPFELGRPFGIPNDQAFQKRVILSALKLLDEKKGPILEDFPDDAPVSDAQVTAISCPVNFVQKEFNLSETGELCAAFKQEAISLRPWYDTAVAKRERTTVGVSGLDLQTIPDFICSFFGEEAPENPRQDITIHYTLNLAVDDLKAYYSEAVTSQPGQELPSSQALSDWFWEETLAGKVLYKLRDVCKNSRDGFMKLVGNVLIVPAAQVNKKKGAA